jgi:Protein of unknown function (DUF3122)
MSQKRHTITVSPKILPAATQKRPMPLRVSVMNPVKFLLSIFLIALLSMGFNVSPAAAEIRQFHESPGKMLYKSQWTLRDQDGKAWQAIAFQVRQSAPQPFAIQLRLVGFPGSVVLESDQPLSLDDRQQFLTAAPIEFTTPPEVGQFDLQPILLQFNPKTPLYLTLAATDGTVELKVPPFLVEEWQSLLERDTEKN